MERISRGEKDRRNALSFAEQMQEAEASCSPCKLCGGKAKITDAGPGWGYYINCERAYDRMQKGRESCLQSGTRLSGWAYNCSDIWNSLNTRADIPTDRKAKLIAAETFYIDCEFDGHDGPLLSIAMVRGDGRSLHVKVNDMVAKDPWVLENVIPIMDNHHADLSWHVKPSEVGTPLRGFIGDCQNPRIIADSPVDIGRFCRAISTGEDGRWHSNGYPGMTFIVQNVDCYPTKLEGAVQHNAWWDAMALRATLAELGVTP